MLTRCCTTCGTARRKGRDPNPLVRQRLVSAKQPRRPAPPASNSLAHYIEHGDPECRIRIRCSMATAWYLARNPGGCPLQLLRHYLERGAVTGCAPVPLFDAACTSRQKSGRARRRDQSAVALSRIRRWGRPRSQCVVRQRLVSHGQSGCCPRRWRESAHPLRAARRRRGRDLSAAFDAVTGMSSTIRTFAAGGPNPLAHYLRAAPPLRGRSAKPLQVRKRGNRMGSGRSPRRAGRRHSCRWRSGLLKIRLAGWPACGRSRYR